MELPFIDITKPDFSTRSAEVIRARDENWCARTPVGLAVLRHRQAGLLLRDRRLRQGSHAWPERIGISGTFAEFWRRSVISQEGDTHHTLRQIAQKTLDPAYVLSLEPAFEAAADTLVDALTDQSEFDFVEHFSEPFAGRAITTLLGLDVAEAGKIAHDASRLGLAMGPDARTHETTANEACRRLSEQAKQLIANHAPDSFVARLLQAADELGFDDQQALADLIVISIFGGVDTTRAQLAFAILLFSGEPEAWAWLRAQPEAVQQALDEVIRTRPTTTWATREALEDFEFDGVEIKAGETVHVFVHASATDPYIGLSDRFDIRARRRAHFGFGGGAHHCLGHFVARTDMAAAMRVLLRRWTAIRLVSEPRFLPDSGNTSPVALRVSADWA